MTDDDYQITYPKVFDNRSNATARPAELLEEIEITGEITFEDEEHITIRVDGEIVIPKGALMARDFDDDNGRDWVAIYL